jgi:heat shock protein HslJ
MRVAGLAVLLLVAGCSTMSAKPAAAGGSLEGGPWLVEDINKQGVIDNARGELTFDPGDHGTSRVSGRAFCNRFTGAWTQNGNQVTLGPLAMTRMACPDPLMALESKFTAILNDVKTVSFDKTGAAILATADGRTITIRREKK